MAFVASATTNGNGADASGHGARSVNAGNGLLLIATGAGAGPLTAPAGWTQVGTSSAARARPPP